jgi:hypothetical protein
MAWQKSPLEPIVMGPEGIPRALRRVDPILFSQRNGAVGDGDDANSVIRWQPTRHDLPPTANKTGTTIIRAINVLRPTTQAGSTTASITTADLRTELGVTSPIQVHRIEVQAVGSRVATFVFGANTLSEQLGLEVDDCAPPNAWPGVLVEYPRGTRPTLTAAGTETLVSAASSETFKLNAIFTVAYQI